MASSPPTPTNTTLSNPKKRPSLGLHALTTQPDPKRQKIHPHPLRQSSYPNPAAAGFYASQAPHSARSETGSVANSLVSGSVASTTKGKKPRGRPKKSVQLNAEEVEASLNADSASQRAPAGDGKSVVSGRGRTNDEEVDEADDDDEDAVEAVPLNEQERLRKEEEDRIDQQKLARLLAALTPDQTERYAQWKRTKIGKSVLRKIVNQTVSQSVTANPLTAIMLYSKSFIGDIIERARDVQEEWAKARDVSMQQEKQERIDRRTQLERELAEKRALIHSSSRMDIDDSGAGKEVPTTPSQYHAASVAITKLQQQLEDLRREERIPITNHHRGGLLPEHVREGLRRYKGDGEGGGVGFASLSHNLIGVPGPAAWRVGQGLGGRRLFK